MNTDAIPANVPRYEKLSKPKERIDRTSNYNAFNVKPEALSYQITDSINKLAQPKRKQVANISNVTNLRTSANNGKERYKLINSNEQSKDAQESKKKKFLLDTYARIVAARNKRCSKRLHELAKPKNPVRNDAYDNYDYFQTMKKYDAKPPALKKK
ncbi:uncharacterized protein LOC100876397 [Megachile rotundata]|uniref:uncharacterized protein LOC100876397 n=1 Tax=Megachile rotundata TaxID=143995 RepID=UPI000614B008|nr:PREDICTED: uncharacterized protein LOC100876397 [Megachile rotundata]